MAHYRDESREKRRRRRRRARTKRTRRHGERSGGRKYGAPLPVGIQTSWPEPSIVKVNLKKRPAICYEFAGIERTAEMEGRHGRSRGPSHVVGAGSSARTSMTSSARLRRVDRFLSLRLNVRVCRHSWRGRASWVQDRSRAAGPRPPSSWRCTHCATGKPRGSDDRHDERSRSGAFGCKKAKGLPGVALPRWEAADPRCGGREVGAHQYLGGGRLHVQHVPANHLGDRGHRHGSRRGGVVKKYPVLSRPGPCSALQASALGSMRVTLGAGGPPPRGASSAVDVWSRRPS